MIKTTKKNEAQDTLARAARQLVDARVAREHIWAPQKKAVSQQIFPRLHRSPDAFVGTDLSAVITWVGLGLCAAEPHHFSSCVRVN